MGGRASFPQAQRGKIQPGRPPLGPLLQLRQVIIIERDARVARQQRRLIAGERQVTGADLQDPALGAQPRDAKRRQGLAREHQRRAVRDSRSCSGCTSSRTSATGEVIEEDADPSLGMTVPGTERQQGRLPVPRRQNIYSDVAN